MPQTAIRAVYMRGGTSRAIMFRAQDLPVIMGSVLIGPAVVVIMNLVVDIAYSFIDPRVRLQ